jgi:hypothetical protein
MLSALAAEQVRNEGNSGPLASRLTGTILGTAMATFGFDTFGNYIGVGMLATTVSDKENRMAWRQNAGSTPSYLYTADNMKRVGNVDGAIPTLIPDGSKYLEGKK